jgi:FkbM family methyltransferase
MLTPMGDTFLLKRVIRGVIRRVPFLHRLVDQSFRRFQSGQEALLHPGVTKQFTVAGVKLEIDGSLLSPRTLAALRAGNYEDQESGEVPGFVQEGDRILELGGGIGFISSIAARQRKAESIVVFEANPQLVPVIKHTHQLNGVKATVVNAVVVPKQTTPTLPFYLRDDFWASSLAPKPWGYSRTIDVPTRSLADVLAEHKPTLLIVDIEGGEIDLFDDVELPGVKKVYLELHQNVLGRAGMKKIFDFFSSRDFHYDVWHSSHSVVLFSHVLR